MHFNIFWTVIICAQLHHQIVELFQSSNFLLFNILQKFVVLYSQCTSNIVQC